MHDTQKSSRLTAREVVSRTLRQVVAHELMTRASAIAFSSMMAAVPFLALVLTLAVNLLPDLTGSGATGIGDLTSDQVAYALRTLFPEEIAVVITEQITRMQEQPPIAIMSLTLIMLLWMASSVFVDIIDALNRIYGVKETRRYWRVRLTAIFLTLIHLGILILCLVAIILWPQILKFIGATSEEAMIASTLKWVIVFTAVLGSFALTFKLGPDYKTRQRWVTPGSFFGTVVFLLATYLFRVYVQEFSQYDRLYGSLGGVMALLFWLWISSLVLLVAAEMNRVVEYAVTRTRHPTGKRGDDAISEEAAGPDLLPDGQEPTGDDRHDVGQEPTGDDRHDVGQKPTGDDRHDVGQKPTGADRSDGSTGVPACTGDADMIAEKQKAGS